MPNRPSPATVRMNHQLSPAMKITATPVTPNSSVVPRSGWPRISTAGAPMIISGGSRPEMVVTFSTGRS